jgi:3-oxoacyl-[acyl-carrier-protein] synthase II
MPSIDIGITGWGSLSPLGGERVAILEQYRAAKPLFFLNEKRQWEGRLPQAVQAQLQWIQSQERLYRNLDQSALMAMLSAKQAVSMANWKTDIPFGINLGSSRGATGVWEGHYDHFREKQPLSPQASPTTTLGNIASWTAHFLQQSGALIEHSITCSTGMQSIANAVAWLEAGRYQRFLAGATEAPLTNFTIDQMRALRVYAEEESAYPCRSLDLQKTDNTMVLGEGAACFCLEAKPGNPLAWIGGIGFGREPLQSATSISDQGLCLQQSMRMALAEAQLETVDVIVCHAPGTRKGDQAEVSAIGAVFGEAMPVLTSNKWQIGHCLGASGSLSMELALLMLQEKALLFSHPFWHIGKREASVETVMVNTVGFGGQAISILLQK